MAVQNGTSLNKRASSIAKINSAEGENNREQQARGKLPSLKKHYRAGKGDLVKRNKSIKSQGGLF